MNKKTKWGIIILVGAGIIGGGIYSQLPKKNDELAAADKVMGSNKKRGKQLVYFCPMKKWIYLSKRRERL